VPLDAHRPGLRICAGLLLRRLRAARGATGQASVELALVLPVLVLFLLGLVQTALVARDQVLLQDAARAAAREASVGADPNRVRDAARRSLAGVTVEVRRTAGIGEPVVVVARYHDRTDLPIVGRVYPDLVLTARATMRAER
jgi:Flp pilus assembly protein TadG